MRSELTEVRLIDRYLLHQLDGEERKAFEVNLLLDEALAEKVAAQRIAHRVVRRYSRTEERRRLEGIYEHLMQEAAFAHQLQTIFS